MRVLLSQQEAVVSVPRVCNHLPQAFWDGSCLFGWYVGDPFLSLAELVERLEVHGSPSGSVWLSDTDHVLAPFGWLFDMFDCCIVLL